MFLKAFPAAAWWAVGVQGGSYRTRAEVTEHAGEGRGWLGPQQEVIEGSDCDSRIRFAGKVNVCS